MIFGQSVKLIHVGLRRKKIKILRSKFLSPNLFCYEIQIYLLLSTRTFMGLALKKKVS